MSVTGAFGLKKLSKAMLELLRLIGNVIIDDVGVDY